MTRAGAAVVAAVDLGASGGRVIAGQVSRDSVTLHEVSRFPNDPVRTAGTLHWDILRLYADVVAGLRQAAASYPLASAGIDSWAIDYGLLDATGALIGNPVHYRDARTEGVSLPLSPSELYAVTGIQYLPFNTIYQLAAAAGTPALAAARTLLLIPDLLAYWLTGAIGAEVTNASTTALLDVSSRTWATGLMKKAGIPASLFPALRQPGDVIGAVNAAGTDGTPLPLVAVGSHDTASAVVAVPADGPDFARTARPVTQYHADAGQPIASLQLTPDGETMLYAVGSELNDSQESANPESWTKGVKQQVFALDHLTVAALMGHRDGTMLARVYSHVGENGAFLRKKLIGKLTH